jgi:hypothetical protein
MLPANVVETYEIIIINLSSVCVTEGDTIFGIRITPSNYCQYYLV